MKINKISLGLLILFIYNFALAQRSNSSTLQQTETFNFDLQGHRGARGLAPENTLPAFKKALELGVTTLEMDVVISKDKQLVVSHEPWLNFQVTLDKSKEQISEQVGLDYKIYDHNYEELLSYDVGSLGNVLFPDQVKEKVNKPLLRSVIQFADAVNAKIKYNIEIKSTPEEESKGYQPTVKEFSDLLVAEIKKLLPLDRVTIQSFDLRVLRYIHEIYPDFTLAFLVFENDFASNMANLGFIPQIYSPYYVLLSAAEVAAMHKNKMQVIPWTVNSIDEMKKLLKMGVDGIITDYPNIAVPLRRQ